MKPIEFPHQNTVFAEDQPEYNPLPALVTQDGAVLTKWSISDEEIEVLKRDRYFYILQQTFHSPLQPINVFTEKDLLEMIQ